MNTQTLILGILNFQDASGYEIKKKSTDGAFRFFVDISYGSIYPTLTKLEADGLVTGKEEAQSGKPDKKVYSITDKGRLEFIETLAQPPAPDKFKSEFMLIAMCADITNQNVIRSAIQKRIEELEEALDFFQELHAECEHPATRWITSYGLHVKRADLEYLRNNQELLLAIAGQANTINDAAE